MNLVLFEWKLIVRSKRLKQQLIMSAIIFPLIVYLQLMGMSREVFLLKMFFLWIMFALPANFATFSFGANAAFMDKLLIAPAGSIFKILQAKYRLYYILSIVFFVMFLPSMFLGIKLIELIAAFLFAVGLMFFSLFLISLLSHKPFDIKASTTSFNYQEMDVGNMLMPMLVMSLAFGIVALFHWLFNETITLVAMSLIGTVFIATHKIWLKKISKSFEKTKYRRLERFREK